MKVAGTVCALAMGLIGALGYGRNSGDKDAWQPWVCAGLTVFVVWCIWS